MLGLIKKDLLMIKSNLKILVILLIVYGFWGLDGGADLSFIIAFMSVSVMISTFSYDAYNKWDAYTITLPDGRNNSVKAKYLATILLIVATTIILTILGISIAYFGKNEVDLENIFEVSLGSIFATTLIQSFMFPVIYKFGVEKARIGIFVVVFGVAIIGSIIMHFFKPPTFLSSLDFLNEYIFVILPIVIVLMLFISYKISNHIYSKKEF